MIRLVTTAKLDETTREYLVIALTQWLLCCQKEPVGEQMRKILQSSEQPLVTAGVVNNSQPIREFLVALNNSYGQRAMGTDATDTKVEWSEVQYRIALGILYLWLLKSGKKIGDLKRSIPKLYNELVGNEWALQVTELQSLIAELYKEAILFGFGKHYEPTED